MWMPIISFKLRGIFRTQSNICDGDFSENIVDVRMSSKYASEISRT